MTFGGSLVRNARLAASRSVTFGGSLVRNARMTASSVWADRVATDVRDVAVPLGFAQPWWKVRLRGAVPVGSAK